MPSQTRLRKIAEKMLQIVLLLLFILLPPLPVLAGILDGFIISPTGTADIAIGAGSTLREGVRVVAIQPWDGAILIGGEFTITGGTPAVTLKNLARISNEGILDTDFAPEPDAPVNAIVIEQDKTDPTRPGQSRIYIGGEFSTIAGAARNGLARFEGADSTLDTLFAPATDTETVVNAMVLQSQKIIVGGSFSQIGGLSTLGGEPCRNLAAVSIAAGNDGALVEVFSGGTVGVVNALLLQDGFVIAGGEFTQPRQHLARFLPGYALDAGFPAQPGGAVRALALQADGKVLVGGDFTSIATGTSHDRNYLARLTSNGEVDSFDAQLDLAEGNYVASLAVQPDGKILAAGRFVRSAANPKQHLARFTPTGSLDEKMDTETDDVIHTIALQPNGKFLIGGRFTAAGGQLRSRLARFYFHGGLDDDGVLGPSIGGYVYAISERPDGTFTIGGWMSDIYKLNPDFSWDDSFGSTLNLDPQIWAKALQPDGKLVIGGNFSAPWRMNARLDENGEVDGTYANFLQTYPPVDEFGSGIIFQVLSPKGARATKDTLVGGVVVPQGGLLPEKMMYLGARLKEPVTMVESGVLVRVDENGVVDEGFQSPHFDGGVRQVAIQPDNKLLVAGEFSEKLVRLHTNGEKDETFKPWVPDEPIISLALQRDGRIIIGGHFRNLISPAGATMPVSGIVRLNNLQRTLPDGTITVDGSPDGTFKFNLIDNLYGSPAGNIITLLANGQILVGGWFTEAMTEDGTVYERDLIAVINEDGTLDTSTKFLTIPDALPMDVMPAMAVQADGKLVLGGSFSAMEWSNWIERPTAEYLTRLSHGWATEELTVAPDGKSITWLRGGTAPDCWQVFFEETKTPDIPASWTPLVGAAEPVTGGWRLGGLNLTIRENRYIRARGYTATFGYDGGNRSLQESVRQYYLKEPIKVKAQAVSKVYGEENETSYAATYIDAAGQPIVPDAGTFFGAPGFSTTRTPSSPVGTYAITADVSGMSSPVYSFVPEDGTLTVTKRSASVEPDDITEVYGESVEYGGTLTGFLSGDNVTATYSHAGGDTVTGSPHTVSATLLPVAALGNYDITYGTGNLTFTKKPASVTPNPASQEYGSTAAEVLTGSLSGFLESDGVSAAYSRLSGDTVTGSPYTISATLSPAGVLDNYDITYGEADFTITKKAASVTPTAGTKEYGSSDPGLSGTLSGFLVADNVTAAYSRLPGDTVTGSPYTITATLNPSGVLDNYDITYGTADFTITKKAASVTPTPAGKEYGSTAAELLTGTLNGFIDTDNVTAAYSRAPGNSVAGGPYTISATLSPANVLDNYNITYGTADFTITKKAASVTPTPAGKEYGSTAAELLTGTLNGFIDTDNVTAAYSRAPGNSVAGGPYTISATLSPANVLDNYNITYGTADFTITKKAASVTPTPAGKEYGSTAAELLTGTLSGFIDTDNVTAAYSRAPGNSVAGGPYTISATLSPANVLDNYNITYGTADFTITKKAASVTPTPAGKEYGSTAAELLTGTLSGFLDTDNVTAAYSRAPGNSVAGGPYTISATLSPANVLDNYNITYGTADFTITKKSASVTPTPAGKEYGSTAAELLTGTLNGFIDTDNVTAAYSRAPGNSVAGGPYTISATLSPASVLDNYDITYGTADFTITKKAASVTPTPAGKEYGSTAAELLTGTLSGFLDADGVTAAYSRVAGDTVAGSPYTISAILTPAVVLGNYDITYNTAPFSIMKKPAAVTLNAASKVYGTPGPDPLSGTLSGFLDADGVTASYSRAPGETVAGNPYAITATLAPAAVLGNYDITYNTAPFSIMKKPAAVTLNAASKVYGTPGPDPLSGTLSGFLDADGVTASYSRAPGETVAGNPYAITATLAPAAVLGNYDISYGTADFTITRKPAAVTLNAASKVYGTPGPDPLSGTLSGFLDADGVTASYSRAPGETVAGNPYAILATLAPAAVLGNYDISYGTADFTITRKPAAVTLNAASKVYGTPGPDPLSGTLSGFLDADGVTASYSRAPGETVAGNPYAITATLAPAAALGNYDITYHTAGFVIGKKPAAVTAVPATKVYGEADPPLLTESSGFLPADLGAGKITVTSSRPSGENAGAYLLTPVVEDSGTGLLSNYQVTPVSGSLTISKAPLTITAQDKSRTFGAPNPEFTATFSGLAGWDTPDSLGGSPAFSTTADAASTTGSYPIVPAVGTMTSTNYDFTFVNGILTVMGGAPQSITFNPMRPKTYGDGDFDPGAHASSNLPVSYASSAAAVAAVAGGRIRVLAPGNAEITASQGGNEMFAAAEEVTRGLVVNPPPWNGAGFDGSDDFIEVADGPQLNFGSKNGFSIESWLYLDGSQPDGTGLLSKGEGGDPWSGYQLILHQNRIAAEIGEGTVTVGAADGLVGSSDLADGKWHHVAVAVDRVAATATLYLDGRVEAELSHPALGGNVDNAAALRMGAERSGSRFFKGRIDEVRLWDSARSREEIRASVSQIIDPLEEPHLVAYFHFDEGDAGLDNAAFATAPERTSYAANGTLRNFALTGGGSNWISSGAFLPLLETAAVGSITSSGATAGGNVYPNYYPATEVGLCWGTARNPGEGDSCSSYGSGPGTFTGAVSGLDPGTTYHVRGYARNQLGTAYGNDVTFQTAKLDQTITFGALEERTYGDAPFLLNGSSSSGLTLTYTSSAPDVAEVAGDQVTIKGAGTATITAWQAGNATYNAAAAVLQSFTVNKKSVTVTADDKSRAYLADNPLLTASYQGILAGEEGAVTGLPLLSTTATRESLVGSYPITAAPGTLSAANYRFVFAGGVLTVGPAAQQIVFNPMRPKTFGDRDFDPGATASSGLPVAYASSAPGVAAVAGNRLRVLAPGTAAITASQAGSGEFDAASGVTRELVVNPPPWNGLGFDGIDDVVRVADGPQLSFGGKSGFTIESWLYLDGTQQDGSGLLTKGEGGSAWSGFNLFLHQDRIAAEIGYGAGSVGITEGLVGSSSLNDGQWHHVALSVDRLSATASLYLDGRLEARLQNPLLGGNPDNLNPLRIGVERSGSRFFKGHIDELRVWDAARSREEIREYVSRIIDPLDHPDLVAYLHLDEGDASLNNAAFASAPERTAHAADGALLNFALNGATSNWIRSGAFLPLLETAPPSLITSSAATGGGVVYPNYYPADDFGLCWSSAPGPTLSDSCSHSGSGSGAFVGLMAGLTPGVTYHVRGFATNQMGTAYGNDITFQAARLEQSISFGPIGERTYGDPGFPLVASASSSLPVTYASSDPSVAVVENGMILPKRAGRAMITASQGGNQTFNPAAAVSQPFTVNKKELTVSADAKSRAYRTPNPAFTVSYRGFVSGEDSGVISGAPQLTSVASLDSSVGSYPIVVGVGSLGADNYRFLPVNGTLTVFQSCQEIIFPPIGDRTYGDPPVEITASSCSGLGLSFASSNPLVATVSGNLLTITGAGSSVITASQRGSGDLEQAPDVSRTVVVHKRGQVIDFPPLPQKVLGDDPLLLEAAASSGLPVSYASSDPAVATVSGSTLTIAGAGTAVITARQEGSGNFHPALPASRPLTVALEGILPTLTLSALPSGSATASPVVNVAGSAQDDSGIASLTVNGADLTGSAAQFSSAVPLAVGENSITVTARDGAGNVASETLSVTLDATAPAIAVAEPADNSVTDLPLFTAQGTVPAGSAVTMAVNGAAPQALPVASGTFTGTGFLQAGLNTVELSAQLSGRSAVAKRSVTFAAGAPPVAITDPGEDLRTEADSVVIRGRVGTRADAGVRLEVNGASHTPAVEGGVFQQLVAMDQAGEYRIKVTATGSDGNSSSAQRNIIKVERISGDLDRDGVVDIGDAIALLRISLGIDPVTDHAVAHGDLAPVINGVPQPDGRIGVGDVLVLLRKIVGLIE